MKRGLSVLMALVLVFGVVGCSKKVEENNISETQSITVSAAASLTDAMAEIAYQFEKEKNITITFNFASSGKLQKQIEEGAPVDVFVSAGKKQMDALEANNLIDKDSREDLLKNKLVMIVANEYNDKINEVSDLVDKELKLSIGVPETVPVGQYAKETLEYLKLWDGLSSNIVFAKDVSQVVTYVEKGEVAAGIVYSSDAARIDSSTVKQEFADETHRPIVYPAAIIESSNQKETGKMFLEYLRTEEVKEIFNKYGFQLYTE